MAAWRRSPRPAGPPFDLSHGKSGPRPPRGGGRSPSPSTPPRRPRILPGFIIIGAQRAGTTSLFYYLRRHPDVRRPSSGDGSVYWPKELHYFDERYDRGLDWYRTFFPLEIERRIARMRGRELIAGEATPYYLFHPLLPERGAEALSDVRLVA